MFLGYVETIEPGSARGWVYDKTAPGRRVQIELVVDGWPIATAPVDINRADLSVLNIGRTDCAFDITIPSNVALDVARMGIRVAGSQELLPLSSTACRIEGVIEDAGPDFVSGWAYHIGYPSERLMLDVKIDGRTLGSIKADQFRDDLLTGGLGDGYYGFRVTINAAPEGALAPGRVQMVERNSGTMLADRRLTPAPSPAPAPAQAASQKEPPRPAPAPPRVHVEPDVEPVRLSREAAEALRQSMGLNDDDVF